MTVHKFDWQKSSEGDFLKWMIPTLISGIDKDVFEHLSEATSKWTDVRLLIQINGVDVPVKSFVDGIEHNMEYFAKKEARELIAEIPRLEQLRELLAEADRALSIELRSLLRGAGVEIDEDD